MPESVLNNTTNAVFIPTIIAQKCLQRLPAYLNLARTVSRDSDWVATRVGQTIQVPKTGAVVANDKTAGENFTKQNPTGTNVDVTLDQHKEVTITIDDVTAVLENQDTQMKYGQDGAIALAEAIETSLAELHSSITYTVTFDATSTATKKSSLLALRKQFVENKVPKVETKYLYVDPTLMNELLEESTFTEQQTIGSGESIKTGIVMRLYGFDIHESQIVATSGSPVAYHNLAYTRAGLVLATRPLPKPVSGGGVLGGVINDASIGMSLRTLFWYNGDLGAHQLTMDVLYGVSVLDDRRVVEFESF